MKTALIIFEDKSFAYSVVISEKGKESWGDMIIRGLKGIKEKYSKEIIVKNVIKLDEN